jgi:hypothetical protein
MYGLLPELEDGAKAVLQIYSSVFRRKDSNKKEKK